MKRKYLDRHDWIRVLKKRYALTYIKEDGFEGHVGIICLDKVKSPLFVNVNGRKKCVADDGYIWVQYLPKDAFYTMVVMLGPDKRVIEWYFDIISQQGQDGNGSPWYDDLYLDIVVSADFNIELLDEDDLQEALEKGDIGKKDYDFAYLQANQLLSRLSADKSMLMIYENHLPRMIDLANKTLQN